MKLLAGNPGGRSLNETEPQPDVVEETLPAPKWLSGEGRAVWAVEFPKLVRNAMITEIDLGAFAKYCQAFGRYLNAESMVAKQGEVLIAPGSGFPIQNPYLAVSNKAQEQMHKAETEFGMTPSSRSRVSTKAADKKKNRFLALVADGKKRRA
ncbi:MAG: phage terminase small subunit P27 family [Betaproteobacteria bacterium]|nr:phage terminase small subunit P27 family [Betaproteobacteria bacterium]